MAQGPDQPNAIGTRVPPMGFTGGVIPIGPVAASIGFGPGDAVFPTTSIAPAPAGRNGHPILAYPDGADVFVFFPSTMGRDWGGVSLSLDLYWASPEVVGDVVWFVAWERDNEVPGGVNLDADSFAAEKSVVTAAPAATGELQRATIPFTAAEADSVAPGDPYRLRVRRAAGAGNDTLAGIAQLFRVTLGGPP